MPEKDYFRCSQFFLGLESPGNFQWEGYWSPLLHRCAGNHSWAPCWNWKERTLMSFCNSCVSLSFPTIKSLRAHSDCICLCILTCKKQDDPKAKCNNNQNGNKYNRHQLLQIVFYIITIIFNTVWCWRYIKENESLQHRYRVSFL